MSLGNDFTGNLTLRKCTVSYTPKYSYSGDRYEPTLESSPSIFSPRYQLSCGNIPNLSIANASYIPLPSPANYLLFTKKPDKTFSNFSFSAPREANSP